MSTTKASRINEANNDRHNDFSLLSTSDGTTSRRATTTRDTATVAVVQPNESPVASLSAQTETLVRPRNSDIDSHGSVSTKENCLTDHLQQPPKPISGMNSILRRIYLDTFLECAYSWCPIVDRQLIQAHPEFGDSMLLIHSLAIVGSNLKPPFLHHAPSFEHYQMARHAFYSNHEKNQLVAVCAIMMFHYWDTSSMNTVNNTDSQWWWLGNSIRLAQDIGLHRESKTIDQQTSLRALKRRIWWTLFVSHFPCMPFDSLLIET